MAKEVVGTIVEAKQVLKKVRLGQSVTPAAMKRAILILGNMAERAQMELRVLRRTLTDFR